MEELRKFRQFSKEEIAQIAREYATTNNTFSRSFLANEYFTTKYVISKILAFSIIHNLVTDEITEKIMKKACKNAKMHGGERKTRLYYEKLIEKRQENIQIEIEQKNKENEISQLQSIISSFSDYFYPDEGSPTLEELTNRLEYLIAN